MEEINVESASADVDLCCRRWRRLSLWVWACNVPDAKDQIHVRGRTSGVLATIRSNWQCVTYIRRGRLVPWRQIVDNTATLPAHKLSVISGLLLLELPVSACFGWNTYDARDFAASDVEWGTCACLLRGRWYSFRTVIILLKARSTYVAIHIEMRSQGQWENVLKITSDARKRWKTPLSLQIFKNTL